MATAFTTWQRDARFLQHFGLRRADVIGEFERLNQVLAQNIADDCREHNPETKDTQEETLVSKI